MKLNVLKSKIIFIVLLLISVLTLSCGAKKDIVYFQDVDNKSISMPIHQYRPVIRPSDILTITVSALDYDAVKAFNLPAVSFVRAGRVDSPTQQTYLVDSEGYINFPVLGSLKIGGLNRTQAINLIEDMLKEYIKDPIVNIRILNFKVSVLGEVARPGVYTVENDRITILEAIGLAGDLTLYAKRDNVLVVREENGKKTYNRVDLTSEDIFNSPIYYLTQNDIIYVEPNSSRIKSSTVGPNVGATLSVISTLATVAALIVSITR